MTHQQRILIVDDEPGIRKVLERYLLREGFLVEMAENGKQALEIIDQVTPDLIILDLIMPALDGLEMTRRLRAKSEIPVIMLTSKDEESDKLAGLEVGADDYVTKPFSVKEVVARVKTVLRRAGKTNQAATQPFHVSVGALTIDEATRTILLNEQPVKVSAKQFDLLLFLAQHPGQVFSREHLLNKIWGYDYVGNGRIVDVHIRRLREKVEPDSAAPKYLLTEWSVGYKFTNEVL